MKEMENKMRAMNIKLMSMEMMDTEATNRKMLEEKIREKTKEMESRLEKRSKQK